ncbi:hypothetical protein PWR63_05095 [Paraburkholderia sp. A2WS-5]|uniref:hypothetical protein n=1 Tax=Paraburkholderia sp. A2WS-5 TaxID=3028372 RepID=UPI003B81210E
MHADRLLTESENETSQDSGNRRANQGGARTDWVSAARSLRQEISSLANHAMRTRPMNKCDEQKVALIGIDLGKRLCCVYGRDKAGKVEFCRNIACKGSGQLFSLFVLTNLVIAKNRQR